MMTRAEAAACALAWKGTPYVRGGRIRGVGCDCGTLLAEYLVAIGACPVAEMDALLDDLGFLSNDWFCHADEERYERALARYAPLKWEGVCMGAPPALPGDIALYRVAGSKRYNHGSIILAWPLALHALQPRVAVTRPSLHAMTSHMPMALFDPFSLETR
jgi:cell wall-associated NlpC family hydrolase